MAVLAVLTILSGSILFFFQLISAVVTLAYVGGYHYDDVCSSDLYSYQMVYAICSMFASAIIAISLHPKVYHKFHKFFIVLCVLIFTWSFFSLIWTAQLGNEIDAATKGDAYDHNHPNCSVQLFDYSRSIFVVWLFTSFLAFIYPILACAIPPLKALYIKKVNKKAQQRQQRTAPTDFAHDSTYINPSENAIDMQQANPVHNDRQGAMDADDAGFDDDEGYDQDARYMRVS